MSVSTPATSRSVLPDAPLVAPSAADLRGESRSAGTQVPIAALLHEAGVASVRAGDLRGAVADFAQAWAQDGRFREPLEALLALVRLGVADDRADEVFEALENEAESPDDLSRALVEKAAHRLGRGADEAAALALLQTAIEENPEDVIGWLELQRLATRAGDRTTVARCLAARGDRVADPVARAALAVARAEELFAAGDLAAATEAAQAVLAATPDAPHWRAIELAERAAQASGSDAALAQAVEARAEVAARTSDVASATALGIPEQAASRPAITESWLRAALAWRRAGNPAKASELLARAYAVSDADPIVVGASIAAADAAGDVDRATDLSRRAIAAGAEGRVAAALWTRIGLRDATRGNVDEARDALARALTLDPGCLVARAAALDLAAAAGDRPAFASLLAAGAAALDAGLPRAEAHLLAAFADRADAASVARELAAAESAGMPREVTARIEELLARLAGDTAGESAALERRANGGADPDATLAYARQRSVTGDGPGAARALASIATNGGPEGWIARVMLAFAPLSTDDAAAGTALDALAREDRDPVRSRAWSIVAALRLRRAGDRAAARERLASIHATDPDDLVAAAFLADLARDAGDTLAAADVLGSIAARTRATDVSRALGVEAALLRFHGGDRTTAAAALAALADESPSLRPLATRARTAAEVDSVTARRDALAYTGDSPDVKAALALERFAVEALHPDGDARAVLPAIEVAEREGRNDLALAACVARILADAVAPDADARERALDRLALAGKRSSATVAAHRLHGARQAGNLEAAATFARVVAESDASLSSALAWLVASHEAHDARGEVSSRHAITSFLPEGEARDAIAAEAAAIGLALGANPAPLPASSSIARWMNLELSPMGSDPRRRAAALDGVVDLLGDDPDATADAALLAGWNHWAAGDQRAALAAFVMGAERRPEEPLAWQALRETATDAGDARLRAQACEKLGALVLDDANAAGLWEEAAMLYFEQLEEPDAGEHALERAVARDRRSTTAFDKLFRRLRDRGDNDRLLYLVLDRIDVVDDPAQLTRLFWEQARVLRKKGDRDGALAALDNVVMIEPDHVGALALAGEIHISEGRFEDAAEALAQLASLPGASRDQRLMSGVAAVDLYENKLHDGERALAVLVGLHESGLSTLPVRERLARAAARSASWLHATQVLEQLMVERPKAEGRVEAARLAMAIWRDKLREPARAANAIAKLLEEAPDDAEAIAAIADAELPVEQRAALVGRSRAALARAIARNPLDAVSIRSLAALATLERDLDLRQAALGSLVVIGQASPEHLTELSALRSRQLRPPAERIDGAALEAIADPDDRGPLVAAFAQLGAAATSALGPTLDDLGVSRKHRVDTRTPIQWADEIMAWASALGIERLELYVGDAEHGVHGVPGDPAALVVSAGIRAPLSPVDRQAVVRELFALSRGTTITRTRDDATVAALVAAACRLADVAVDAPESGVLHDVERKLGRALGRKARKALTPILRAAVAEQVDASAWARAVARSACRFAVVVAGDPAIVLADALGASEAELAARTAHEPLIRAVIAFALTTDIRALRDALGSTSS